MSDEAIERRVICSRGCHIWEDRHYSHVGGISMCIKMAETHCPAECLPFRVQVRPDWEDE